VGGEVWVREEVRSVGFVEEGCDDVGGHAEVQFSLIEGV
jgi:hypothetical protein